MLTQLRPALILLFIFTLITGVAYPLLITCIAQAIFPQQANGSLIFANDHLAGSSLIGQPNENPRYFWSRPSATSPFPGNSSSSSGSNLGPTNTDLLAVLKERVEKLKKHHPDQTDPIPVDLVTTSASGLDPHISPAAAEYQVGRIAKERNLPVDRVRSLVAEHTLNRTLGLLGEPRVNVLKLNLALDDLK
ncbi:MAG TPA: potassium-transporting ATPase subunit KdpC [Gemmatales bacterium]|nr:potassium-transporting ATPase subunit KdpC [Gemmatales bacterium]